MKIFTKDHKGHKGRMEYLFELRAMNVLYCILLAIAITLDWWISRQICHVSCNLNKHDYLEQRKHDYISSKMIAGAIKNDLMLIFIYIEIILYLIGRA